MRDEPGVAGAAGLEVAGWISSRWFDLTFFTLSPLAGLLVVGLALNLDQPLSLYVQLTAFYLVAVPHYLSTYTFFMADDTLAHYRTRRAVFFGGPLIIAAVVLVLMTAGFPMIVQASVFVWNVYHVSMQSSGILSLYRRLNGGPASEGGPARWAILAVNGATALWHVERYRPIFDLATRLHPALPRALSLLAVVLALGALARYVPKLLSRVRPVRPAEWSFLFSSLLLFHPYLWVRDYNLATLGMLMGHFIQYLAIVWLLHHRKYAHVAGSRHQQLLGSVSDRLPLLAVAFLASGLLFYASNQLSQAIGLPASYTITWFALTFIHFYLDGLIWAFRDPFVRQSLGPYLTLPSHMVA